VADLARLIDTSPDAPLELEIDTDAPPVAGAEHELLVAAREQRAERTALERRVSAALERVTAAEAGRRPAVSLVSGYDYIRPNPRFFPRTDEWQDSWDVGVNVSWSLWDGGRTAAERAEAAASATAARERLADFDERLAFEVRQRRLELDSARAQIEAAAEGERSAAEGRRVLAERFDVGVATSTELLDAEVVLLQADLDRTRALAGARLAAARLERALGR
jgi:outer membrane protein TolC